VNRWDAYRDAAHQRLQAEETRRAGIDAHLEAIDAELAEPRQSGARSLPRRKNAPLLKEAAQRES
jgi:hypothetical protein